MHLDLNVEDKYTEGQKKLHHVCLQSKERETLSLDLYERGHS